MLRFVDTIHQEVNWYNLCTMQALHICIYIPLLGRFTILGQKNVQNMPHYNTLEQGKNMY